MAKSRETTELEVTPIEEVNAQEIIEAIKPKTLYVRRQSQRIPSETNVSELPQLYYQLDVVSTQTLIEKKNYNRKKLTQPLYPLIKG